MGLIQDESADDHVRANAAVLLADRGARRDGGPAAPPAGHAARPTCCGRRPCASCSALRRTPPGARNALRAAAGDPSATVRLNVLQRLDVEDAPLVRALLAREGDAQVRTIARQLLELLEARGARLVRDPRGDLRGSGRENMPQIVFHPTSADSAGGGGDRARCGWSFPARRRWCRWRRTYRWWTRWCRRSSTPTAPPSCTRRGARCGCATCARGDSRSLGAGVAPRVIPFTEYIVFVREVPGGRARGRRRLPGGLRGACVPRSPRAARR